MSMFGSYYGSNWSRAKITVTIPGIKVNGTRSYTIRTHNDRDRLLYIIMCAGEIL